MSDNSKPFLDQITSSYVDVPTKEGIPVVNFLAATEDLVKLFDILGSTAFSPVKSDMNGNIKKIREKFLTNPEKYNFLQSIVVDEASLPQSKRNGTEGLMWLRRGLEFTSLALNRNIKDPNEELSTSFSKAYESTLQKYHNMIVRPIFALAMKACPNRKDFYTKISGNSDESATIARMKPWLEALDTRVQILVQFFKDGKYEW
jgi:hypothetical protein